MNILSHSRPISTNHRHIDDRLLNPTPTTISGSSHRTNSHTNHSQASSSPTPPSLLLLSTSAEAAVAQSRIFERGSRHSSIVTNQKQSPTPSPSPPPSAAVTGRPPAPPSSASSSSSSLPVSLPPTIRSPAHGRKPHHHHLHPPHSSSLSGGPGQQPLLFKCEKCPKVYRHPQCLVKHRWEHTSYWADASKLMLSKHQQVQMLEAAAILAAPSGSLPESRSLWPAAVSPPEAGLLGSDRVNLNIIRSQALPSARTLGHHHSASLPSVTAGVKQQKTIGGIEMKTERRTDDDSRGDEEDEEEDEIMFEMTLDSDDQTPTPPVAQTKPEDDRFDPNLRSIGQPRNLSHSAPPPPMGYFPRRNQSSVKGNEEKSLHHRDKVPGLDTYQLNHQDQMMDRKKTNEIEMINKSQQLNKVIVSTSVGTGDLNGFIYHHHHHHHFKPIQPYASSRLRFKKNEDDQHKQEEFTEDEDEEMDGDEDDVIGMEL